MTEYPSEAEIQTLIEQIDEQPWSVDGYEFAGGSEQTFTVTFAVEWVGEEPTPIEEVDLSTTTQSDDRRTVKSIVAELEDFGDVGAPIAEVLDRAEEIGMDRDTAASELETLRRQGDVYEPATDHLREV
jgi:DNA replicative helicase MCM subunit Mcm2 (Cdc46/Mcm family)